MVDLTTQLGPVTLRSPVVAAAGTVGSVVDFAGTIDFSVYGAAVAKSVAPEPWPGNPAPRIAGAGEGLLNAVGIQNPGIDAWVEDIGAMLVSLPVEVWGSAVAQDASGYGLVADRLASAGVAAVELNLSCPNLEGEPFAFDPAATAQAVAAARAATTLPIGAKLAPVADRIVDVAAAARDAGADWVVLTNTAPGFGIDTNTRRPRLARGGGGLSGPPLKPLALRCVWEVARAHPEIPVLGCGGVSTGADVVEYLLAGASAVAVGTIHFSEPRAAKRIVREVERHLRGEGRESVRELIGAVEAW